MRSCLFPCGHVNYLSFDRGDRYVPCGVCGEWAGVKVYVHEVREYVATPTNYKPKNPEYADE